MDTDITYMFRENIGITLFYLFDILLISTIFILVGLLGSSFINNHIVRQLNRSQPKLEVFLEVVGELLLTFLFVYFALFQIPKIPTLIPDPHPEHKIKRLLAKEFLLTFAVLASQLSLLDKIRFLLNETHDKDEKIVEDIIDQYNICSPNGFKCGP